MYFHNNPEKNHRAQKYILHDRNAIILSRRNFIRILGVFNYFLEKGIKYLI